MTSTRRAVLSRAYGGVADGIPAAIERNRTGPRIGKVVADFSR